LKLKKDDPCYIWKPEEDLDKIEAIADISPEKSLKQGVLQVSQKFQEILGTKVGSDLIISASEQSVDSAESIILKDITNDGEETNPSESSPDLAEDKLWEVFLKESLCKLFDSETLWAVKF